ncbi:MAG: hypothetical protein SGI99_07875 [Pseudomonadota bacterium]|nr:hypothetical protein [Pseudomonadota bacterium]
MSTKPQTNVVARGIACLTIWAFWVLGAIVYFRSQGSGQAFFRKAHIIRVNGDLQARGVVPDIAIVTPLVQAQDDPVLQRALKLVGH